MLLYRSNQFGVDHSDSCLSCSQTFDHATEDYKLVRTLYPVTANVCGLYLSYRILVSIGESFGVSRFFYTLEAGKYVDPIFLNGHKVF